jgi:GAF domain-containing protein
VTSQNTSGGLAETLRDFARLLSDEHGTADILDALCEYCARLLPVDSVGVLLRDDVGDLQVATASTEIGHKVEQLEVTLRQGPCTTSMQTGLQVLEPDLSAAATRYPDFVPAAIEAGAWSIHGLPLTVRVEQIGALNVIGYQPLELTAQQLSDGQLLADVAVAYLANRRTLDASSELARQLQQALDSRVVIEQAKGKLSERLGVGVNEAFDVLRQHARSRGLKLRDVASAFLAGDLDLSG